MKIDSSGYTIKGVLLTICGVVLTFFPGILTWFFYIVGGIVIIGSLFTVLGSLGGGDGLSLTPAAMVGAGIGLLIMSLPKLVSAHISTIAGIILTIIAIVQIVKAKNKDLTQGLKIFQLVFGILMLIAGLFLMFSPFKPNMAIRIITGVVCLLFAAFNFYIVYVIKQRNGDGVSASGNIIDVAGHDVPDSNETKRIE